MEQFLKQIEEKNHILNYVKPMRKKTVIAEIAKEQNYTFDPEAFERLGGAWSDMEEPIEEILKLLNK